MKHIKNPARYEQAALRTNFNTMAFWGTDIDFAADLYGKGWMFGEFKTLGTLLTMGQKIALQRLAREHGQVTPTFVVFAQHDTHTDDEITGDNLMVRTVFYRTPTMPNIETWEADELSLFTLNQWQTHLGQMLGISAKVRQPEDASTYVRKIDGSMFATDEMMRLDVGLRGYWAEALDMEQRLLAKAEQLAKQRNER